MRKISRYIVDIILRELPFLKQDNIISDETANRVTGYYSDLLAASKRALKPKKIRKQVNPAVVVFTVLGIVSGLLIATGIISLIAFNWNVIPRGVKTGSAFIILLIPQLLSVWFLFANKNKALTPLKEGLSLLWALLFGAVFAFVGQIYKTASYFEMYLFLWALSTLGIIYLYHSISCFTLYIIQVLWLVIYMQANNSFGVLFFPLILLLIPFYLIENRVAGRGRIVAFRYIMVIISFIGLGIALEKSVPGLWIIAYSSLFVLYWLIGLLIESKDDIILLSPFKLGGTGGLITFSFILLMKWPWEEIGWLHFRSGIALHEMIGMFDYLVCALLLLSVIIITTILIIKNRIKGIVSLAVISSSFLVSLLYVLVSLEVLLVDQVTFIISLFITAVISGVLLHSYFKKLHLSHAIVFPLLLIPVFTRILVYTPGSWSLVILFFVAFFYISGMVFKQKINSILFSIYKISGALLVILICTVMLFQWTWFDVEKEHFSGGIDFSEMKSILNFVFLTVFYCILGFMAFINLRSKEKTRDIDIMITGYIMVLPVLYFLNSLQVITSQIAGWTLNAGLMLSILYILFKSIFKKAVDKPVFIMTSIVLIPVLFKITIHAPILFPLSLATLFSYWFITGQYFRHIGGSILFQVYKIIGFVLSCILIYSISFHTFTQFLVEEGFDNGPLSFVMLAILLFATLVPVVLLVKEKVKLNYAILLLPLFLLVLFFGKAVEIQFFGGILTMWIMTMIIAVVCLVEFYMGVLKKSLVIINIATTFFIVSILSRFLSLDVDLLAKAFVLLISGVVILLLNIFLMLKYKNSNKGQIDEK